MAEKDTRKEVRVAFPESLRGGVYSNIMGVSHTKEEFVLDFMMVAASAGSMTARVIISPGHMKRMISTLVKNINKYEEKFGKITAAEEPSKPAMGFRPPSS